MLFGLVSIGDVLNVVFYILMGFLVILLLGILAFRYYVYRMRRRMEENGETFRTYTWGTGRNRGNYENGSKRDGEVTIKSTGRKEKMVSREVGDYVEYEEIREERSETHS